MSYSLDTNVCRALLSGSFGTTMRSLKRTQDEGVRVFVSAIVLHELHFGIEKSRRSPENLRRIHLLFGLGLVPLAFTHPEAAVAANIRADLEKRKQTIGPYDTLIAGHAVARGLTLVTANNREFSRVTGLRWVDWSVE